MQLGSVSVELNCRTGTSLATQWIRLQASNAEGAVRSLVGELRLFMLQAVPPKKL